MLISIVINGYNTRDYIRQCVDSALNQDFDDYEIVIVDDGSTDDSAQIGKELAAKYDKVKSYSKLNGGLADARNFGLERASGEYILYVDGDDYIEPNSISRIWKKCVEQGKPDIVFLQALRLYEDGSAKKYDTHMDYTELSRNSEDALIYISERDMYPAGAWRKLIRRKFLNDNGIRFKKGQSPEDYEWSIQTFLKAQTFGCCNSKYYYYRQKRKGSISNTPSENSVATLFQIIEHWIALSDGGEYSPNVSLCIKRFAAYIYRNVLWSVSPYYETYGNKAEEYKYLLTYRNSRDIRLIRMASNVFGIKGAVKMLDLYRRARG